jgi:hypothetical protein
MAAWSSKNKVLRMSKQLSKTYLQQRKAEKSRQVSILSEEFERIASEITKVKNLGTHQLIHEDMEVINQALEFWKVMVQEAKKFKAS